MDKILTLKPTCITDGSSFTGILTGSDYRTVDKSSTLDVGTVGFDTSKMRQLSKACVLKSFGATYEQNGGGWSVYNYVYMRWYMQPGFMRGYSVNGTSLNPGTWKDAGAKSNTETHDNDYENKSVVFFSNGNSNIPSDWASACMLGVKISASNSASVASWKIYMRSLRATISYEAKYYARFYDGTTLKETQTINGDNRATAPSISKTGYTFKGWMNAKDGTVYTGPLPTCQDTDRAFIAQWEEIKYRITVPKSSSATTKVQSRLPGSNKFYDVELTSDGNNQSHCDILFGRPLRVYAAGFATASQNLLVSINGGAGKEIDASGGGNVLIYDGSALEDMTFAVETKTVSFPLSVIATEGGHVEAPARIIRFQSAQLSAMANLGYYISRVVLDGTSLPLPANATLWDEQLTSVAEAHTLEVAFSKTQVPITFNVSDHVTVTDGFGIDVTDGAVVDYGSTPAFTFHVPEGYSLDTVTRDGETLLDTVEQVRSFTCEPQNVTAPEAFEATESGALITIAEGPHTGGMIVGQFGTFLREKALLSYAAVEDAVHHFQGWTGIEKTGRAFTIDSTDSQSSYTIGAVFETYACEIYTELHTIHLQSENLGTVEPEAVSAHSGDTVSFVYTAPEGCELNDDSVWFSWAGGNEAIEPAKLDGSRYQIILENISSGGQLFIEVTPKRYKLSADVLSPDGENIGGIVYSGQPYPEDANYPSYAHYEYYTTSLLLTAQPTEGYRFIEWSDGVYTPERSFTMPAHAASLTALFRRREYAVTTEVAAGGNVTLETEGKAQPGNILVRHWESLLLTVTADFGQRLADVLLDGVSVIDDVTLIQHGGRYLLEEVTAPRIFTIKFEPRTYANGRKLFDYWPPVIQAIRDMQEIAKVQQPLIDEAWDAVSFLMENQFIDTATEEGVSMWEKELGLVPKTTDTLRQRKARLRLKWVPHNRFTIRWLHEWLKTVCGTEQIKKPQTVDYTLLLFLPFYSDWQTICNDLERYMPCNLMLDTHVTLPESKKRIMVGFALQTKEAFQIEGKDYSGSEGQG